MPWSNSFCASGLHDVSKCTLPSLLSSVCPRAAVRASETPVTAMAATANEVLFMILLLVGLKTELGAVIAWFCGHRLVLMRTDSPDPQNLPSLIRQVSGATFKSSRYSTLAQRMWYLPHSYALSGSPCRVLPVTSVELVRACPALTGLASQADRGPPGPPHEFRAGLEARGPHDASSPAT